MIGGRPFDRRELLTSLFAGGCLACLKGGKSFAGNGSLPGPEASDLPLHPASWWRKLDGKRIECELCPKKCKVADLERGSCGVRENHGGQYYTLVHSRPCSLHKDPIEKKPFNHVLPGTSSLSLATPGCNIECKFCQNWEIAQVRPEQVRTYHMPPEQIAALARQHGTPSISCTYTEPVVFAEYARDIAIAATKTGIRTLLVSNGFILEKPLNDLMEVVGAVKVDLKAYTESFYRDYCSGELQPVLQALRTLRKRGMWTEIVVLVIPTLNDSSAELRNLVHFVRDDLGPDVPVHFTRFHPTYRIRNLPRTPVATLEKAREIAMTEGLHYAYLGNVPGHPGNNTYCPGCGTVVIKRIGMSMQQILVKDGKCSKCDRSIPGIWK